MLAFFLVLERVFDASFSDSGVFKSFPERAGASVVVISVTAFDDEKSIRSGLLCSANAVKMVV